MFSNSMINPVCEKWRLNLSYEVNVDMIRMRNHCQAVCVIPRLGLSMPNWVLEPGRLSFGEDVC